MTWSSAEAAVRLLLAGWIQTRPGGDGLGCWDRAYALSTIDARPLGLRLIQSTAVEQDGFIWSHVSVSRRDKQLPTWEQVRDVFWTVHPDDYGYIVVAPTSKHVSIREVAHIWCRLDGPPPLPDFTRGAATL